MCMTEQVDFYLVDCVDPGEKLKFACRVAHQAFSQGLKVYLQTNDLSQSEELDKLLWTFSQNSFIPHAIVGMRALKWEDFPVQIGSKDNVQGVVEDVDVLISLLVDIPQQYEQYRRIVDLITADLSDKAAGRIRYRFYRDAGLKPNTLRFAKDQPILGEDFPRHADEK